MREAHEWSGDFGHGMLTDDATGRVRFWKETPAAMSTGAHDPAGAAYTEYLKQAARLLIDPNVNDGRLDVSRIDRLIDELGGDPRLRDNPRLGAQMKRILSNLRDHGLQDIINSICDDRQ